MPPSAVEMERAKMEAAVTAAAARAGLASELAGMSPAIDGRSQVMMMM